MTSVIKPFVILFVFVTFYAHVSRAQESKKCQSVHEEPIAIFIEPTDEEIGVMKKEDGEAFYTSADDALHYQWQAVESLEKKENSLLFH